MAAAGHDLWVVGGAVRDTLMGREPGDEDFATSAHPDAVESMAAALGRHTTAVGKRFGTIGVLLDGRWSEITTFRGESYGDTRWPKVSLGSTLLDDLSRRDYTVNAIARHAITGEIVDPFGGRADIAGRLLRTVGEPVARFREDPLRILRGMRFTSQLGFEVDRATVTGMRDTAPLLGTLSQERVTTELEKLLCGHTPARGLELLQATGGLAIVLPELAPMVGCEQNSYHRFDVWGHTVATVAAMQPAGRIARWAALLHDLGKPAVRHLKEDGSWGFFAHETTGARMAEEMLARLKIARKDAGEIALMVRRHMDRPNVTDGRSVRRYLSRAGKSWPTLVALKWADNTSHTYDDSEYLAALEAACDRIAREDPERLRARSPLTGEELMTLTGRPPGPWLREAKERLSAMVLDGALEPGDKEGAIAAVTGMANA
jgi:poly(A) polymerase